MKSTHFSANLGKVALGSLATLIAAGPSTFVLFLIVHGGIGEWIARVADQPATMLATSMALVSLAGLFGSLPATVLNTAIQEKFLLGQWDSWVVGAAAGAVSSALVIGIFSDPLLDLGPEMKVAMGLTGILMGLLYWCIAIRPRRLLRLAHGMGS
jgi:hypothetical protein